MTSYVSGINQIVDTRNFNFADNNKKFEALSSQYLALNTSAFNIQLRINIHEKDSQRLLSSMQKLREVLLIDEYLDHHQLRGAETALIASSQDVLKSEWKRVKSGEKTFRFAKQVAIGLLIVFSAVVVYVISERLYSLQPGPVIADSNFTVRIPDLVTGRLREHRF